MASSPDTIYDSATIASEFVIGITGHRDVATTGTDSVRAALKAHFEHISSLFDHVPVRIVTGLAEGADTLATEVALEMGLAVSAVLPMPVDSYRNDFSGAARDRFDELLADPRVRVFEMPLIDRTEDELAETDARDAQYQLLGDYLVRRANILVAIWDGKDVGLVGGTSDVVMRYLSDGAMTTPNKVDLENGMGVDVCGNVVCWVPAARTGSDAVAQQDSTYLISNANFDCYWQAERLPEPVLTRWKGFDDFHAERVSRYGADLPAYGLTSEQDAFDTRELEGLDAEFIRADQLARTYQTQSHRMFALFGLLAAAMGLAFLIYAKLLADANFLYIYIALFVAGFIGFQISHRRHLHSKHLAFRALAETYRVQFFLILSGAGKGYNSRRMLSLTSVDRFQRFEWLPEAIRIGEPLVYFGHCPKDDVLNTVQTRWIGDQLGYFEKRRHLLHHQHHRLETAKVLLLVGSVVGALSLIYFKKSLLHLDMIGYDGKAWLVFFMGLLPLWAAIWELYQGKMATRELLWQYANQSRYFRSARMEIEQTRNLDDGLKSIRNLADKALIEIYMWSVHRFHREHEPPAAG